MMAGLVFSSFLLQHQTELKSVSVNRFRFLILKK